MAFRIRRPIEIRRDPAPREREDRKQRSRLAEEMKKNFRRRAEESSERNRQLLREQRRQERAEEPPSGPLRELAEAFAPPPSGAFGQAPLRAFGQLEEQRIRRGGEGAREFFEAMRGRPLQEVAQVRGLADVARERRITPQQLVAQPGATEFERVGLQRQVQQAAIPRLEALAPSPGPGRVASALAAPVRAVFAAEQKYIAKHTTPKFQTAFRATLGEALQAVGVSEERANQASDIGGVLLGQVALPTSVVPFVGQGSKLVKVLRAVSLGAGLSVAQEDAFIREFEGRDPELWELLVAAGAGGGGAGVIESGAVGAAFRRLRPGAAVGEVAEEVAPVVAREAVEEVAPVVAREAAPPARAAGAGLVQDAPPVGALGEADARSVTRRAGDIKGHAESGQTIGHSGEFDFNPHLQVEATYRNLGGGRYEMQLSTGHRIQGTAEELAHWELENLGRGTDQSYKQLLAEGGQDVLTDAELLRAGVSPVQLEDYRTAVRAAQVEAGPRAGADVPQPTRGAPARAAGEVSVPVQAVDDFEAVPREAIEASARDLPGVGGGAPGGFAVPLRPFADVAGEVVTRDDPIAQALARSGVSPGLLETTDVGRATVAFQRQRGSAEQIINVTLASAVDSHRTGVGRALPIAIGDDAIATLGNGRRVPWNDLFSTNKFDSELTSAQRAFVDDYRRVVGEVEFLRTQAGLKPRAVKGAEAKDGWFYIPRQVRGIRGMELRRPSSPGLQRHYDEAIEGIKNGIKYESDPRAVLELHLRQAYREIAEKQMSDFLEPLSITPKELVPEKIRARMSAAVADRLAAERARRALTVSRALGEVEPETAARLRGRSVRRPPPEKGFEFEPGKMTPLQRQADVRLAAARKEYAAAKNIYGRALESARKAELAPGDLFGKAEDVIPIGQWRNRFFPLEDAERLNEALGAFLQSPKRANWVGRGFEQLGNHIRFLSAVLDFAAPFIQGLPLLGRNPVAWGRATWIHYLAFGEPAIQARYIRQHIDTFQEMAQHNIPVGDVEFFKAVQEGQGISAGALIERLPKGKETRNLLRQAGKQTFGRFQASYDMFLTSARAQLWESMKPTWAGSLDDLAAHVRNMTGGLDSRALGVGPTQRGFESTWLAFSPRLLRSTVALVADLRLGLKNPRGRAAYQALGGLTAGTVGMYIASGIAMGKSEEEIRTGLNPLEGKKFLSYNINGDWVGVGGQVRAITQLLARSAADPQSLLTPGQFDNPLLQFASSRGAPGFRVAQTIGEAFTGADLLPFDDIDSLPDMFLHIGQSALPFAVQGLLEGEGAGTFALGLAGARTSPETRFETLTNARQAAMEERGVTGSFEQLRVNQPNVALEIDRDPRVVEAQGVLSEQPPRTQAGEGFLQLEETRTEFRGRQQQDDDNLRDFFRSGGQTEFTPQIYSDNARERARELANRRDQIRQDFELEFAERVPDPGTVGAAIENYFGVDIEDFTDSLTREVDWGPFNDAQDRALSGLSGEQREGAMSVIRKNQTDIQRAFKELRDEADMDEYWDIPSEDRAARERFRTLHPRVDAILYVTGTTTKLMSGRTLAEANALVRRLFGSRASIPRSAIRERRGGGGSILPGGGRSILPGGGRSILPGGGRSILP